jgi:hypothetical protein
LFLSAPASVPDATFDRRIDYWLDAKMLDAAAFYDTPEAASTASVLAQIFTSFVLRFQPPEGGPLYTAFMQIHHADSRGIVPRVTQCKLRRPKGNVELVYSGGPRSGPELRFVPDPGPLHPLHYVLNEYLCELMSRRYRCTDDQGREASLPLPASASDFKNWRILSINIGLEGSTTNRRPNSTNLRPQGSMSVGIAIAGVSVLPTSRALSTPACVRRHQVDPLLARARRFLLHALAFLLTMPGIEPGDAEAGRQISDDDARGTHEEAE